MTSNLYPSACSEHRQNSFIYCLTKCYNNLNHKKIYMLSKLFNIFNIFNIFNLISFLILNFLTKIMIIHFIIYYEIFNIKTDFVPVLKDLKDFFSHP